jgi:hypothetical protein
MLHSKALRVIGQALDEIRATTFELEKHGQYYELWSEALITADEWILRKTFGSNFSMQRTQRYETKYSAQLTLTDISWLEANGQKKRRNYTSSNSRATKSLSQFLRTLGNHLDNNQVTAFHVSWTPAYISVLKLPTSEPLGIERTTLTTEKLQQLSLEMKIRRRSQHSVLLRNR